MKTLVELFDNCQLKNVIAGLNFKPEKIIFVGFKQNMRSTKLKSIEKFFEMKNIDTRIEYEYVSRYDFSSIVGRLNSITEKNPDCCFDLTGGRELVLVAMGKISAEKNIPMFQFDLKSGKLMCVDNCDSLPTPGYENISIEECVNLNGGAVLKNEHKWNMNVEFRKDIWSIWEVCRKNIPQWNHTSSALASLEQKDFLNNSLYVECKQNKLSKYNPDVKIIEALAKCNVLCDYRYANNVLSFRYKNEDIKRCIVKSGNILELLCYTLCLEISSESGGTFNDIDIGVMVDWDGIVNEDIRTSRDTRNEIDVFLMRGHTPVFISCKNGSVSKEALYELEAVGNKYGGELSRKILFTTYLNRNFNARNFIIQRAKDMNIGIIEGINKMSREEIKAILSYNISQQKNL